MDRGPLSPTVGGIQAVQGTYQHFLGSKEIVSVIPNLQAGLSSFQFLVMKGPLLPLFQVSFLFIHHLVRITHNQPSLIQNLLSTKQRS